MDQANGEIFLDYGTRLIIHEGMTWQSEFHKDVARRMVVQNKNIKTVEDFYKACENINQIERHVLRKVSVQQLQSIIQVQLYSN